MLGPSSSCASALTLPLVGWGRLPSPPSRVVLLPRAMLSLSSTRWSLKASSQDLHSNFKFRIYTHGINHQRLHVGRERSRTLLENFLIHNGISTTSKAAPPRGSGGVGGVGSGSGVPRVTIRGVGVTPDPSAPDAINTQNIDWQGA